MFGICEEERYSTAWVRKLDKVMGSYEKALENEVLLTEKVQDSRELLWESRVSWLPLQPPTNANVGGIVRREVYQRQHFSLGNLSLDE